MKKGDTVKIVAPEFDTCWSGPPDNPVFRYYYDFEDKTGIFLERCNYMYSVVLFGDEKIRCISRTLVPIETQM